MKRFFGIMPSEEIKKACKYTDNFGGNLIIDAGPKGWDIIYSDGSIDYKDIDRSTVENFTEAYRIANKAVGPLKYYTKGGEKCEV